MRLIALKTLPGFRRIGRIFSVPDDQGRILLLTGLAKRAVARTKRETPLADKTPATIPCDSSV